MRFLLWISLVALGLVGAMVPIMYWYDASQVPRLDTAFDLDRYLGENVEQEELMVQAGRSVQTPIGRFKRPTLGEFPLQLASLYVANLGCPAYFQTPRETGWRWKWRVVVAHFFGHQLPGDGHCEWVLSYHLAADLDIERAGSRAIAAYRIHSFLEKDQLVAYDLATLPFEEGLRGVRAASVAIFRKPLRSLPLAHLAELSLAMPPFDYYEDVKFCKNPLLLREDRNVLLRRMAELKLLPEDEAKSAEQQPVWCSVP